MSTTRTTDPADHGYGCDAFGHVASPFVDGELPRSEHERFAGHLEGCRPCQKLTAEYRAMDVAARTPVTQPSPQAWDASWQAVQSAIVADRARAASAPLSFLGAAAIWRGTKWPTVVRPLSYAAAAAALIAALLIVQRPPGTPTAPGGVAGLDPGVAASSDSTEVLSVACKSPEYMPVVYTTDGDDPFTVIQCALVDSGT